MIPLFQNVVKVSGIKKNDDKVPIKRLITNVYGYVIHENVLMWIKK